MRAGVLLSGCGHQDGSEIREAVFSLLALDMHGVAVECIAVEGTQEKVISHISGKEQQDQRSVIEESARIARGNIKLISDCNLDTLDALVMPGGFGCALNLCDFAVKGEAMEVRPEVSDLVKYFYTHKKPIGAICIAPVIVAKVLGEHGVKLTIGADQETSKILSNWGAKHLECAKGQCVVAQENSIVSTPAYMYGDSRVGDVYEGISKLVHAVVDLAKV